MSEGSGEQPNESLNASDDVPDETPNEDSFNPNDDMPDDEPDNDSFNPNDDMPDDEPDYDSFNPNDDVPDDEPDNDSFNPNDGEPDDEPDNDLFNPNNDVPDETPEEDTFNPKNDESDTHPKEMNNPSNAGTVTVVIPEAPSHEQEQEQEQPEHSPEQDPENKSDEDTEFVNPEDDPMPGVESPETVDMRADMEEMDLPPETEEESEHSPEQEPENEQEKRSNQESESESSSESEQNPDKEWEFINPETGDPVPHQVDPRSIPIEDAIEDIYEQQENPDEIPETEADQDSEQASDSESESEPEQDSKDDWELINPDINEPVPHQQNTDLRPLEEKVKKEQDIEQISSEIQELREKYRQETGKRPIYQGKITKGFDEWLRQKAKSEKKKQKEQENEEKVEPKEDWEQLLEKWINEADEKEIPKEIKEDLIRKIRKYRKFRDIFRRVNQLLEREILSEKEICEMEELFKDLNELQDDIFENFHAFRDFYNENIGWFEYRIKTERDRFIKHLAQKLKRLKNVEKRVAGNFSKKHLEKNWKENLKDNLYKNTTLSIKEKSIINKIIQKDKLNEDDKTQLISILNKLLIEDLISLLGDDFRQHTQNYIKWGWDFDHAVKRLMIQNYLNSSDLVSNLGENDLTSEFMGIMLGDGNLYSKNYQHQLDVSLNPIDYPRYFSYVKNLMKILLNREIKISQHKGKGASLRVYSKEIVKALIDLGLMAGDKTKNQIRVPDFTFKKDSFVIRCLKGLFDTDGTILVDNKRDMRISFQNCSRKLVKDSYRMCMTLKIIPSPKIRYNKKRIAWRFDIAKKDSVKKFFQIVKPEKLKEPLLRLWIASKLIYLNASDTEQKIIRSKIKSWLQQNNKKLFGYSKENSLFLKNLCEKTLYINIEIDLINKTISKALELEKYMYNETRAKKLKFLYEKLRSTIRIVEYLIDQGEINIPHRQTIISSLKRYFKEKNLDYQRWLNENPKMRIGLNADNQIRVFPNKLRNILNEIICRILMEYQNKISDTNVINRLKKEFKKQDLIIMTWLLNSPKYNQPTYQYLNNLIFLNKKLIENYINKEKTNITLLSKDPHVPFDRRTITLMVNHLIKIGILKHDK